MTKAKMNMLLATTAVLALVACGGSSTGGGDSSFEQLSARGLELYTEYNNQSSTALTAMPTGTATYNGVTAFKPLTSDPNQIIQNPTTVGKVELTANFDSSTVSGRLYNFKSSDPDFPNTTLSGQLQLTDGIIVENQLATNLSGNMTTNFENVNLPVSYEGIFYGRFVGENAQGAIGEWNATGTFDASALGGVGTESATVNAIWAAER